MVSVVIDMSFCSSFDFNKSSIERSTSLLDDFTCIFARIESHKAVAHRLIAYIHSKFGDNDSSERAMRPAGEIAVIHRNETVLRITHFPGNPADKHDSLTCIVREQLVLFLHV
jgi:hypothetical protein